MWEIDVSNQDDTAKNSRENADKLSTKRAPADKMSGTTPVSGPPKTAVITCAVLETELAHYGKDMPHIIHTEIIRQGLHNEPDRLRVELQEAVDRVEASTEAEAIVLGYGLCSRGTEGVRTRRCKLVIARAHDCITHLLGSKERYADYVKQNPGTYWYSPGWNKHHTPPGKERYDKLYKAYLEKYGEDNAKFLMESEQHWFKTYDRATYVHINGAGVTPQDVEFTHQCAKWLGWSCDMQCGDPALVKAMLAGEWDDERFLVLNAGETFRMTIDAHIIERVPAAPNV